MPGWQGKSKANTTGYKIFVFLIKNGGVRSAYFLLYFIAAYYLGFSFSTSKIIFKFYVERLHLGKAKAFGKLYWNYYRFGQTLIDKVAVIADIPSGFTFTFDGEDHLQEMVSQKRGGLLLSAHAGNWEAAGHLLQRLNSVINVLMFDGENTQIKNYMNTVTEKKSFNVIYIKNDLSHIYKINEALSANEIVCIHADRFLQGNKTLTTNFFGADAKFPEGPFLLALKLKVPIAYVYAFKENNTHYHFYSSDLKYFYQAKENTVQNILTDFATDLENKVTRYPEQWFNYYDFYSK